VGGWEDGESEKQGLHSVCVCVNESERGVGWCILNLEGRKKEQRENDEVVFGLKLGWVKKERMW